MACTRPEVVGAEEGIIVLCSSISVYCHAAVGCTSRFYTHLTKHRWGIICRGARGERERGCGEGSRERDFGTEKRGREKGEGAEGKNCGGTMKADQSEEMKLGRERTGAVPGLGTLSYVVRI
jgi:hypothetical protein